MKPEANRQRNAATAIPQNSLSILLRLLLCHIHSKWVFKKPRFLVFSLKKLKISKSPNLCTSSQKSEF